MDKLKIIWSNRAIKRLYGILELCYQSNKSKIDTKKLYLLFHKQVKILLKFPEIGLHTSEEFIMEHIFDDYIISYQITEDKIIIHSVWKNKQSTDNKTIN